MLDIQIPINSTSLADYNKLIQCKKLPKFRVEGNIIYTDQESFNLIFKKEGIKSFEATHPQAFDYQTYYTNKALSLKNYALFAECGLGKMMMQLMWHSAINQNLGKTLFLLPLAVMEEVYNDAKKFNFDVPITNLRRQKDWKEGIGLLNYESLRDIDLTDVKGVGIDESSVLKNADGKTKKWLIDLNRKVPYNFCTSATPAPNEQAEYASHALFLKMVDSDKEFWARFFRKEGTKWILKGHAKPAFYRFLSSFAAYIQNPELLGFQRGGYLDHEPNYIDVNCSGGEEFLKGKLFSDNVGLKEARAIFRYRAKTDTERFKTCMEYATNGKQTIIWCLMNDEEKAFYNELKSEGYKLITGQTPIEQRVEYQKAFRLGQIKGLISKAKIMGWGVNLQQADQHIDSGYDFSYEKRHQKIRRSHRYGRNGVLDVITPNIEAEKPIRNNIKRKEDSFKNDVIELQKLFNTKI